jgi:hypothetical protein
VRAELKILNAEYDLAGSIEALAFHELDEERDCAEYARRERITKDV